MRISGLAERTGVPVATLKYYLRAGLLHPGAATSRTQAWYDEGHVGRVRLIRALIESAGLTLTAVGDVLAALDDPPASRHELLGAAQHAMLRGEAGGDADAEAGSATASADAADEPDGPEYRQARALVRSRGWYEDPPMVRRLAGQLRAASAAGVGCDDDQLAALADAADAIGAADLRTVPDDVAGAMRQVVVGTLLTDPVILTLRRFAQQRASGVAVTRVGARGCR